MRCLVFLWILPLYFPSFKIAPFRSGLCWLWLARHFWRGLRSSEHLRCYRWLRRGRSRCPPPVRPLFAVLPALIEPLQRLVNANRQELDHRIGDAQAALQFFHRLRRARDLQEHVGAFAMLVDAVGEPALAPLIHFVYGSARGRDHSLHLLDDLIDLFLRRIWFDNEQLFVNSHSSSFEPWARRLNFAMAISAPSAIMETTASAPRPTSSSNSFLCERFTGASKYSTPLDSGYPGCTPSRTRTNSRVPKLPITDIAPLWPPADPVFRIFRPPNGKFNSSQITIRSAGVSSCFSISGATDTPLSFMYVCGLANIT